MRDPRLLERAVRRIGEQRIREAMAAGAFDDLPGLGRPIPALDEPYDPLWWVKRWLERERLRDAGRRGTDRRYRKLAAVEDLRLSGHPGSMTG